MTRIAAVADLHGNLPDDLPAGDVLIIAGDVCPIIDHGIEFQDRWLRERFYPWLEGLPHPEIVWIAGNHDFACETPEWSPGGRGHYLRDDGIELAGLSFFGTPWVPHLPRWAFHLERDELAERVAAIPPVDILVSHGPPYGYGDRLARDGSRVGSEVLAAHLIEMPPQLCVFGHVHEDHGRWLLGKATLANVSFVDELYEVRPGAAMVFDL